MLCEVFMSKALTKDDLLIKIEMAECNARTSRLLMEIVADKLGCMKTAMSYAKDGKDSLLLMKQLKDTSNNEVVV